MLDLEQKPSVDETMFEISNSLPILFTKFCLLTYIHMYLRATLN